MKFDKRRVSMALLILGMVCLTLGLTSDNRGFSAAAVVLVLGSLLIGGRWIRPRKR